VRFRRTFAGLTLAATLLAGGTAHADARADFEKARAAFLSRNWPDAEEKLKALLDPKSGLKERTLISQSRMYLGAAQLQQGKKDEAKESFEKLIGDDPTFEPDPLGYPGPAIDMFIDVRSALFEQIKSAQQAAQQAAAEKKKREDAEKAAQQRWLEKVKQQAGEEKITVKHSRLIASVPFGVGQFQNDEPVLGWVFLGLEVAAIAGTFVTFGMYNYARSRANEEYSGTSQLATQYQQRAEDIRFVNLGFVAGFVGLAGIGVAQAHVAFKPESAETKKRDLPPIETPPRTSSLLRHLVPLFSPVAEGGVMFGGAGRF
jgi:tetratricopeptide (TPR) repeat protein